MKINIVFLYICVNHHLEDKTHLPIKSIRHRKRGHNPTVCVDGILGKTLNNARNRTAYILISRNNDGTHEK